MRTSPHTHKYLVEIYGISRNKLLNLMLNHFMIPANASLALEVAQIINLKGSSFVAAIYDGTYRFGELDYAIIYKDCTPAQVRKAPLISVSFRAAKEDYNLQPICIVQIPKERKGEL